MRAARRLQSASPELVRRFALDAVHAEAVAGGVPLYLVGGVVRDVLLGRPVMEVDLAGPGDLFPLARRIARRLGGALVPLDPQMGIVRVVIGTAEGDPRGIDLARYRAADLESDLALRDFRINALAWPLAAVAGHQPPPDAPIDPTGGLADMTQRVIEVTGEGVFQDDPLRMLRAFRIGAQLDFAVGARAMALAADQADMLTRVAPERITEEVYKMLGAPHADRGVRGLAGAGLLERVFPGLADGVHVGDLVASLAQVARGISTPRLSGYLSAPASHGASHAVLVALAALLRGGAWPRPASRRARDGDFGRLRLSSHDGMALRRLLMGVSALEAATWSAPPRALDAYRFFRDQGGEGPGALMIQAARARLSASIQPDARTVAALLHTFETEHESVVDPVRLVDGTQIQQSLGIGPGPVVKDLLESIREAQVEGRVHTREEALALAREHLAGLP